MVGFTDTSTFYYILLYFYFIFYISTLFFS